MIDQVRLSHGFPQLLRLRLEGGTPDLGSVDPLEESIQTLAAEGGQVKATNCKGETALGLAVSGKAGEAVVLALLQAGADVNMDMHGKSPLELAISEKAGEAVVLALLQAGADVKVLGPELHKASQDGDVAKVKEMIIALERSPDWSKTINHQNVSNGPRPVSVTEAALTLSVTAWAPRTTTRRNFSSVPWKPRARRTKSAPSFEEGLAWK